MNRALAVLAALLITGLMVAGALEGVSWLMTSPAVWSIVREPWFKPAALAFNFAWPCIWLPFYLFYVNHKKADLPDPPPVPLIFSSTSESYLPTPRAR